MADRYPLIVDSSTGTIKELPSGDNLNLQGNDIVNAGIISVTTLNATTINAPTGIVTISSLVVSGIDQTPITGLTTIYVSTTGNDTTGDGTASAPFASPHKAMESLQGRLIANQESQDVGVIINVGLGTYNYGLKITNTGNDYIGINYPDGLNNVFEVTGGSGQGATVGIFTAPGTSGIVTSVFLIDPGSGYQVGDTLGINTTVGSGLAFQPYAVSATNGSILGPIYLDHPQGQLIYITGGATTGIRPGETGNHFYNQAGVGVGSDPAGTGPNYSWSSEYDSTSPAGAYPNPMVDGRGNTLASASYNASILEAYYGTKLYFHGSDGFIGLTQNTASINNMLLVGRTARGFHQTFQWSGTAIRNYAYAVGISSGGTSVITTGAAAPSVSKIYGGSIVVGANVSIHGFNDAMVAYAPGSIVAQTTTCTNQSSVSVTSIANGSLLLTNVKCLNSLYHGADSYMGHVSFYGGLLNNHGQYGMTMNHKAGAFFSPTVGSKTIAANNGRAGIRAQQQSFIRTQVSGDAPGSSIYIHGNGLYQIYCSTASYIIRTGAGVSAGAGSATLYSPALNTIAANTTHLID